MDTGKQKKAKSLKRVSYILTTTVILLFFAQLYFGLKKRRALEEHFVRHGINGKIIKIKDLRGGNVRIWLDNADSSFWIAGFSRYLDSLRENDSLYKKPNTYTLYYYKRKQNGEYYLFDIYGEEADK